MARLLRSPTDPAIRHAIRAHLREQGYWHGELAYYTKRNVALNVLMSISAIRDEQNTVTGYVVVCRDITERLKAEQRLIKFNEELSRQVEEKTAEVLEIFERVTDAFMGYDRSGNIVYLNGRAKEMMSRVGIDTPGKNIFREFPVAVNSPFGLHFEKAMRTQQEQHFEMWSEVLELWLETHMYPSRNGISQFFRNISA